MSHLFKIAVAVYAATLLVFAEGNTGKRSKMELHRRVIQSRNTYTLTKKYTGEDFLNWTFFTGPDPTHGTVNYVDSADALEKGLATVVDGVFTMAVDDTTILQEGSNRDSVRITSREKYSAGLFIADIQKMPFGCSVWPAWWSVGPDWPNNGEIDVIEGVNMGTGNQVTLHTNAGCAMSAISSILGTPLGADCVSSGSNNAGCAYKDDNPASYGAAFNDIGGGVYAHVWDNSGITVWHFTRGAIPEDITAGTPDPSGWGKPVGSFSADTCSMDHFREHQLVFDITLCGDWAGPVYPDTCSGSCSAAVADPGNFGDAKWVINSVAVYNTH